MLRKTEDGHISFLTNHDRNNAHQVYIKLNCGNAVEELDPLTGEVREVETVADGEGVCFTRTFETGMSRIYFVRKKNDRRVDEKSCHIPISSSALYRSRISYIWPGREIQKNHGECAD